MPIGQIGKKVPAESQVRQMQAKRVGWQELSCLWLVNVHAGWVGNPKPAPAVLVQLPAFVLAEGIGVESIVGKYLETVTIVAVQAIFSGYPKKSVPGLEDVEDHAL
jgi:hypothetical protein